MSKKPKSNWIITLLSVMFIFTITACGSNKTSSSDARTIDDSETEQTISESFSEVDAPEIISESIQEFSTDSLSFSYNDSVFELEVNETDMGIFYNIRSDFINNYPDGEYNTVCSIIEWNSSFYDDLGSSNIETFLRTVGDSFFNSHNDKTISSDYVSSDEFTEVQATLDGNTKYYVKLMSLTPDISVMAILRLCDYTSQYNDLLLDTYNSAVAKDFTENYPLVTYADIQTGNYNGQRVLIDAIVDKVQVDSNDSDFALWYPYDGSYIFKHRNGADNVIPVSSTSALLDIENGDIIRYATEIYEDGSFGTVNIFSSQIIGHEDINEVHSTFKESCLNMEYENIARNPDDYEDAYLKFSGTVFQVVDESDYSAEYLISTSDGYVFVNWYDDEELRGSRILEDDSVTIYGWSDGLKTYDSLTKENTVPRVSVIFIELE